MQVLLVPVVNVDQFWPQVRDGIQTALLKTGGDLTVGGLWQQCRAGDAFLVVVHDEAIRAAAIVRPEVWQTGTKLRVLALYGTGAEDWFEEIMNMGKRIAADCGATSLVFEGRPGWERFFPKARKLRVLYEDML